MLLKAIQTMQKNCGEGGAALRKITLNTYIIIGLYRYAQRKMWPIVTNISALCMYVCVSVTTMSPTKAVEPVEVLFPYGLGWSPKTMHWVGARIPRP